MVFIVYERNSGFCPKRLLTLLDEKNCNCAYWFDLYLSRNRYLCDTYVRLYVNTNIVYTKEPDVCLGMFSRVKKALKML